MREKEKDFISYLDDNDKKKDALVDIIQKTDSYVEFRTDVNVLTLPWTRILKIKQGDTNE